MKTRPHDVGLAQNETIADQKAASGLYQLHSHEWFAEVILLELKNIVAFGLFACYDGFGFDWQADFWANFPWNQAGRQAVIELIRADQRYPELCAQLHTEFQFDLDAELQAGYDSK